VHLLKSELDFNQTLADTLEQLQIASGLLDGAQEAAYQDELPQSLEKLENARKVTDQLEVFRNTRFVGLLQRRANQLKELLSGKLLDVWNKSVVCDPKERRVTVYTHPADSQLSLDDIATALSRLSLLGKLIPRLHKELDNLIIEPRFTVAADGAMRELNIDGDSIQTSGRTENPNASAIVEDVRRLIDFLTKKLPKIVFDPLLEMILPSLMVQLISGLDSSLPTNLEALGAYEQTISEISELAKYIDSFQIVIPSDADLSDWIQRLPVTWMSRRREAALAAMRSTAYKDVKIKKSAEHVETQMVAHGDVMVTGNQTEDDWNADWAEDAEEQEETTKAQPNNNAGEDEEEDASAWDVGDDSAEAGGDIHEDTAPKTEEGEEDAETWGWGDEPGEKEERPQSLEHPEPKTKANGSARAPPRAEREITLRESFTITALPDSMLELIAQVLTDSETLSSPTFPIQQIATAAPALSSIPTLLLALYRATATTFYASDPASNMLLYNDTQHLISSLQGFIANIPPGHPLAKRLRLDNDIRLLSSFAKRAYGREMDSQRTILRDLLSSASGFANCSAPINAREYSNTVQIVVDRIRDVDKAWRDVLSESARLQSLGSLLSTVIAKIVSDVLELADDPAGISEEQSGVLKGFCDQVGQLSDLFEQVDPSSGETRSLVQVYTPDWFRFVYLGEILEASLADIKYLWTEGELGLEFEMGEVVDLVQALFADSEYRRSAIRDIRSHGGGR
jgi:centromere/kinetochore protein ZW10